MNTDENRDRLVDMLLWESVGKETPPDLRTRILQAIEEPPRVANVVRMPASRPVRPRRVRARPAKPSKLPALAAAAVVALLGVAGVIIFSQQISAARTPTLAAVSGTADRKTGPVHPGESLSTGPGSSAVIRYQDGTVVELSPETTIVAMERLWWERSKGIEVVGGRIEAKVAPQPEGSPLVLVSKDARAEVIGTILSFQIEGDRTRLEVTEGKVRFVPRSGDRAVIVKKGVFAEAGSSGFRTGTINVQPQRGITRFTLMNAETDQPLREDALTDGETISLASLPTEKINIRADFEGEPPPVVKLNVTRHDGDATGLPPHVSNDQKHPPFFAAGDYWSEGRPNDCRAWTPRPGRYRLSAEARYAEDGSQAPGKPLVISFRITE